jgi:transposase
MQGGDVMSWTLAIGVDTHKHTHTACALDRLGRPLATLTIAANADGYRELVLWASELGEAAFALEGTGC